jgi:hypothetical protein
LTFIALAFRRNSTPEDTDETSEIHMPGETQGTHASLLSIAPHRHDQDIKDWAEGVE